MTANAALKQYCSQLPSGKKTLKYYEEFVQAESAQRASSSGKRKVTL
jgi:hypothetical protein